jgi:hypothetical protein
MIQLASLICPESRVRYTGVDLFEDRAQSDTPFMTLKAAHRLVVSTRAKVRLLPGDPLSALARAANSVGPTDLVVVSAGHDPSLLDAAWFYFPRMMHQQSAVYVQRAIHSGGLETHLLSYSEIQRMASTAGARRAA